MLRLWNRLLSLNTEHLTFKVFTDDWYMAQSESVNWCYRMWEIFTKLGIEHYFYERKQCDKQTRELFT